MPLFLWHLHALTVDVAARSNLGDRCRHQKKHIVTTVDVFAPALQGSPVLVEANWKALKLWAAKDRGGPRVINHLPT